MISYVIFIFIISLVILIEFFLKKNSRKYSVYVETKKNLEKKLTILRELSYLFSNTRQSFESMFDITVRYLLQETNFHTFIYIERVGLENKLLKYMPETGLTRERYDEITELEEYFVEKLEESKKSVKGQEPIDNLTTIPLPLNSVQITEKEMNYCFVLGVSSRIDEYMLLISYATIKTIDEYQKVYIKTSTNILNLMAKRSKIDRTIPVQEQMKAVNAIW